eukprot:3616351-Amphidinium_carterae.2
MEAPCSVPPEVPKALQGKYLKANEWHEIDVTDWHCVAPMTSGTRVSVPLHSPRHLGFPMKSLQAQCGMCVHPVPKKVYRKARITLQHLLAETTGASEVPRQP